MISTQYVVSPECLSQIDFFLFYRFHIVLPTTDPGYKPCTVTRKMVPITGRARSFLLVFKNKIEREGETE